MHTRFFPLPGANETMLRRARIAQEFHLACDDSMPLQTFMYLSDKVLAIWKAKKEAVEAGQIYIGG